MASGAPLTSISMAPQKQLPIWFIILSPCCGSQRLAPRNKHRDALPVLAVLIAEHLDQVPLLEVNAEQDVDRGDGREQQMAHGHGRRGPERNNETEIDRMTNELVEQRRAEARRRRLPVHEMIGDLRQPEQFEVVDDERAR